MHIIVKGFSKEVGGYHDGYILETVSSLKYLRELKSIIENEPEHTLESIQELLAAQPNGKDQIPLEMAIEHENIFGILHVLKFTKIESINAKRQQLILQWLFS